ncbi:MAG: GspE/PulE family protein [Candidatus Peribacteraceae bacterium]
MPDKDTDLGKILLAQNYVAEEEINKASEESQRRGVSLKGVLMEMGLLTEELYEGAMAEYFKLPYLDIRSLQISSELVCLLPEDVARSLSAVVVKNDNGNVTVATSDPSNPELEKTLRANLGQQTVSGIAPKTDGKKAGLFSREKKKEEEHKPFTGKIELAYAPRNGIESLFMHYRKPLATRFQSIINEQKKVAPEIITEIFNDAIELRASDIHFEPQEKEVLVRFRVDGVMHEAGRIPKEYYEGVVNRIKISANMQTDEHFTAQDGAIRYLTPSGNPMDIRASIVPIVDGEKIVLRLLSEYVRTLTLNDLGFGEEHRTILEKAAHKPYGMILSTGPTGAGKSTTLYALMKLRNHPDVNISTIEDPVEYKVPGINHIQVNAETGLSFAKGLRALVRQDPNIILVGEIRDGETASIAVNAALTGHLLFSTLHSNDAATGIPRLLDMGVEPFLLASTLEVMVGQRLLRRICPQCRTSGSLTLAEAQKLFPGAEHFFQKGPVHLYHGKGCDACGGTGYRGRVGIYELLEVTPAIRELIVARASSADLNAAAVKEGMITMFDDGFAKVMTGMTTVEELLRVAAPPIVPHDKKHIQE